MTWILLAAEASYAVAAVVVLRRWGPLWLWALSTVLAGGIFALSFRFPNYVYYYHGFLDAGGTKTSYIAAGVAVAALVVQLLSWRRIPVAVPVVASWLACEFVVMLGSWIS